MLKYQAVLCFCLWNFRLEGAPFFELLDVTISRSMVFVAEQVDIAQARITKQAKNHERSRKRLRSVTYDTLLKLLEEIAWSFMHMHCNRLLHASQRAREMVFCEVLGAGVSGDGRIEYQFYPWDD